MSTIYEIFGRDAHAMTIALMERAEVITAIPAGASVALKPNLVVAGQPEYGATTHAGVLSGAIEYLREHGVRDISIIEGSWVGDSTGRAFRAAGYDAVGKQYSVPLYDLKGDKTRQVDTPLRPMDICCRALDAGYLINLPVLKGHCQARMTCALKNCKGCLPDREKRRFHAEGLMEPIAALAAALRPALTIVDSICGDLDFEEGGNPVEMDRIFACKDPVLCDSFVCRTMGYQPQDVPYIPMAEALGVGSTDLSAATITALNEPAQAVTDQRPSRRVQALGRYVCADAACSACYGSLLYALNKLEADYGRLTFDDTICIGQNYRGKTGSLGIGSCTQGFACSLKGCPPSAAEIYDFLLAHMTAR